MMGVCPYWIMVPSGVVRHPSLSMKKGLTDMYEAC